MTLWAKNQNWSEMSFSLDTRKKGKKFSTPDRLLCCITCAYAYRWLLEWSHLKMCSKRSHSAKKIQPLLCAMSLERRVDYIFFRCGASFAPLLFFFENFRTPKKKYEETPGVRMGYLFFLGRGPIELSSMASCWSRRPILSPKCFLKPLLSLLSVALAEEVGRNTAKSRKVNPSFENPSCNFCAKKAVKNFMLWNSRKFLVLTIFWLQMYR